MSSDENRIIVDLQGFKDESNKFILKEITVLHDNDHCIHFIIKPSISFDDLPYEMKDSVHWLVENHHGLDWDSGFVTIEVVKPFLRAHLQGATIFVKGTDKVKWMQDIMNNEGVVINLEDIIKTPSLRNIINSFPNYKPCSEHEKNCTTQHVLAMQAYIKIVDNFFNQ